MDFGWGSRTDCKPRANNCPCKEEDFFQTGTQSLPGRILFENAWNPSIIADFHGNLGTYRKGDSWIGGEFPSPHPICHSCLSVQVNSLPGDWK